MSRESMLTTSNNGNLLSSLLTKLEWAGSHENYTAGDFCRACYGTKSKNAAWSFLNALEKQGYIQCIERPKWGRTGHGMAHRYSCHRAIKMMILMVWKYRARKKLQDEKMGVMG